MKINILLLEKGCLDCAYIRVKLDFEKTEDDSYVGNNGEKLFVFFSSSSEASILFSQRFEVKQVAPILKIWDGKELENIDEIIQYIKVIGYGKS